MDRKLTILGFSESLERDLSNGIKVDIREIKVFGIEPTHGNAKLLLERKTSELNPLMGTQNYC